MSQPHGAVRLACLKFEGWLTMKALMKHLLARFPLRGLLAASAAGMLAWAVAQSQVTSEIGSFVELGAQVTGPVGTPTLYSTDDVTGRDEVRWTAYLSSRLAGPFVAEGEQRLPPGQTWLSGSVKKPGNVRFEWEVNGNWTKVEPANGTAVTALRWFMDPMYKATFEPVSGVVDFKGTGDGVRVIPYKDKLFVVNHYGNSQYFNCREASTGLACPGFSSGGMAFEPSPGTPLRPAGNSLWYTGANPLEAVNYRNGEMFVAVTDAASSRRMVLCTDLNTLKSCGSWDMGPNGGASNYMYVSAFDTIGAEYYFGNATGDLLCFNIQSRSPCGRWAVGVSTDAMGGAGSPSIDSLALGSKLFVNGATKMVCFDTTTHSACAGWPLTGIAHSGGYGVMPYLSAKGDPLGVCTSYSGARACFNVAGQSFQPSAAYQSFVTEYGDSIFWSHHTAGIVGTRFFEAKPGQVGCFDFKTDARCGTVASGETYPYTTRVDPTRANCVMAMGDQAVASLFDATDFGPCKNTLNGVLPDIDVLPDQFFQCDPTRARIRAWQLVRVSTSVPWGGANGLTGMTVTLKDAKGQKLPDALRPVRAFADGKYTVDISDIPYADYPVLKLSLELKSGGNIPPVEQFGVDVSWDGDPMQVCASTKMPASPDCLMTSALTVKTRLVDSTDGVFQESLGVSKTLSPGGLSSGYSALATPTSPRAVLSDLGARDPKTHVVQGRWALQYFSGDLWAFGLGANGQIDGSTHLSAQDVTAAASARPMFTAGAGANATPVKSLAWGSLTPTQQTDLNLNLNGVADGRGSARLDYLRGADGGFRARSGKTLGPVINSSPAMLLPAATVGLNERHYPGYGAYRANVTRPYPMALYGGNDGALHAYEVRSAGLREAWSLVPNVMLRRAANYADPTIAGVRANPYFVDNIPMVGHVNTGGANGWRAVAVVTYGRGARAITALDVTSQDISKGSGVLFEYTNTSDPELKDLGYIISQPVSNNAMVSQQMVQLAAGASRRPAVLVGNGINSNDGQGGAAANGTGRAVLYAFYLDQGGERRWQRWAVDELWAGAKSEPGLTVNNGLSTPTPVDLDDDGRIDLVYAGDLQGNLWRFDVRNPAAASVTRLFKTEAQQPITQAPFVSMNPNATGCGSTEANASASARRCWQVVFATGAAISPLLGSANVATQSIYGVLDKGTGASVARGNLTAIPFEINKIINGVEYRALKPTTVNYRSGALGWVVDLQAYEHGVGAPRQQPTGLVMFSSIRPTTPDKAINVCIGPRSWLNEVDPLNGYSALVPFDTNGDGNIDGQDRLNPDSSTPLSPAGMAVSGAQFGPPALLLAASNQAQQMSLLLPSLGQDTGQANSWSGGPGSGGNSPAPGSNSAALTHANKGKLGRMTWREKY